MERPLISGRAFAKKIGKIAIRPRKIAPVRVIFDRIL